MLSLLLSVACISYADDKAGHDKVIEKVLFGNETYSLTIKSSNGKQYKNLQALEHAIALAIDQYNHTSEKSLEFLREMKVRGLPKSIAEIDYPCSPKEHRRYTHRGFNLMSQGEEKTNWETRRTILLETVAKVFGFSSSTGKWPVFRNVNYDPQCEEFAGFLYYIHIIEDYQSGFEEVSAQLMPLVRAHQGESNSDSIISELNRILPVILEKSAKQNKIQYDSLMYDIKIISSDGMKLEREGGMTSERFPEYQKLATRLLDKLSSKMPGLLKDEPFFREVFY